MGRMPAWVEPFVFVSAAVAALQIGPGLLASQRLADDGSVSGMVLPAPGESKLPRMVWVILSDAFGRQERMPLSDSRFSFKAVPAGDFMLAVEAEGYQTNRVQLNTRDLGRNLLIALGPRLVLPPLPSGSRTVHVQSLRIPRRSWRALETAARASAEGRLDEARSELHKAIAGAPQFFEAYNNLGYVYLKMGQLGQSEIAFLKALELNPDCAVARANLGLLYLGTGRNAAAAEELARAVELDHTSASTQTFLGEALYKLVRYEEAEASLRRALALDPKFALAYSRLGYVYLELNRNDEALEMFRRFLLSPDGKDVTAIKELVAELERRALPK